MRRAAPSYCAIVSPTGEYLAHSNRGTDRQAGRRARRHDRPLGRGRARRVSSTTTACRFTSTARRSRPATRDWARCDWALRSRACGATCAPAAQFAPLAFLGPACCMVAGAVLLNRMVRPVADIEQQLFQVAMSPSRRELRAARGAERRRGRAGLESRGAAASSRRPGRDAAAADPAIARARPATAGSTRCSTAFPTAWPRPTPTGRLTYTNLPMAVILGLKDVVGAGDGDEADGDAPRMTEQLVTALAAGGDGSRCWRTRIAIGRS